MASKKPPPQASPEYIKLLEEVAEGAACFGLFAKGLPKKNKTYQVAQHGHQSITDHAFHSIREDLEKLWAYQRKHKIYEE